MSLSPENVLNVSSHTALPSHTPLSAAKELLHLGLTDKVAKITSTFNGIQYSNSYTGLTISELILSRVTIVWSLIA